MGKEKERGYEIVQVAIKSIDLLPVFAMRDLEGADVDGLAESIKTQGLINPVLVRPKGTGWELICGHRRYLAFCKLKAPTIPAHVIDATDEQAFVLALTENIERRDPTPMEDASAFKRAMDTMHMKPEAIAKQVGRSPSWVLRRVQLLELEPRVQECIQDGTVSATMAEEAFLKLKHQGDQLELLKDIEGGIRNGQVPTAKATERAANELVTRRAKIEAIANVIQKLGAECKFPKCPKCGSPPRPDGWDMDLKKNRVQCSKCYQAWNLVKGIVKDRETNLDGGYSSRSTSPAGENVVHIESSDHRSNISVQEFFDFIAAAITKTKSATVIETQDSCDEVNITITVDKKKLKLKIPEGNLSVAEAERGKEIAHKTDISLQVMGNWGGDNKEVLEHRAYLWGLEKAIDPKAKPAEIVRHAVERLVIDHIALAKGRVLETKMDDNTVFEVLAVHQDYTAILQDTTHNETRFFTEPELRGVVKAFKKAGGKAGKKPASKGKASKEDTEDQEDEEEIEEED